MNSCGIVIALFAGLTLPLGAQTPAPVFMPAGHYVIQARDTAKAGEIAIVDWPLELNGNGTFTITRESDSLTSTGKLVQKDGMATDTDQGCDQPAVYVVRADRGGYRFDLKSTGCTAAEKDGWPKLLFLPGKPKK